MSLNATVVFAIMMYPVTVSQELFNVSLCLLTGILQKRCRRVALLEEAMKVNLTGWLVTLITLSKVSNMLLAHM